jgi:hypothetical protein
VMFTPEIDDIDSPIGMPSLCERRRVRVLMICINMLQRTGEVG